MANLEPEQGVSHPVTVSRRAVVKALGAIAVWPYLSDTAAEAFATIQATQAPPQLAFLTAAQYTTLDALTETIIPADDHAPGAREARVADYIDLLLSESDDQTQRTWTAGLALLDAESRRRFKVPYAQLTTPQATELLTADRQERSRAPRRRSSSSSRPPRTRQSAGTTRRRSGSTRNWNTRAIGCSASSSAAPIPSTATSPASKECEGR